jgi:hypothetical protein
MPMFSTSSGAVYVFDRYLVTAYTPSPPPDSFGGESVPVRSKRAVMYRTTYVLVEFVAPLRVAASAKFRCVHSTGKLLDFVTAPVVTIRPRVER